MIIVILYNQDCSNLDCSNQDCSNQDIINKNNKYFIKSLSVKKYDWNNFCKVDKKINSNQQSMPKIGEYDLKNPSLRIKGVKNKKSRDNIVEDV